MIYLRGQILALQESAEGEIPHLVFFLYTHIKIGKVSLDVAVFLFNKLQFICSTLIPYMSVVIDLY